MGKGLSVKVELVIDPRALKALLGLIACLLIQ